MGAAKAARWRQQSKQFIELNKQFFVDNPRVQACTTKT